MKVASEILLAAVAIVAAVIGIALMFYTGGNVAAACGLGFMALAAGAIYAIFKENS